MRYNFGTMALTIVTVLILCATHALTDEINREFDAKKRVTIETISGDVEIRKGGSDKVKVTIRNNLRPRDAFEPIFRDRGRSLRLEERIYENSRGDITWFVEVPDETEIKFNSASGNLSLEGLTGEFKGNTASGDYYIYDCRGIFDLNTASGDYTMENCEGEFDVNSASGDFDINNIVIKEKSDINSASGNVNCREVKVHDYCNFNSASGDVEIELAESPGDDIKINSASGDAYLDYNGNEVKGTIELTAKRRGGRIRSDIDFDQEEEFRRHGRWYVRKTATIKDETPYVSVSTASGRAELRK